MNCILFEAGLYIRPGRHNLTIRNVDHCVHKLCKSYLVLAKESAINNPMDRNLTFASIKCDGCNKRVRFGCAGGKQGVITQVETD